jgi:hypothetical protein
MEINEGDVVIVSPSGQAGTFIGGSKEQSSVLLRNGDLWHGRAAEMRHPQGQEDLDATPIDVDKFKDR